MNVRAGVRRYYRTKWGEPARHADFHVADLLAEVLKWDDLVTGEGVTLYTTLGASDYPIDPDNAGHRIEFVLSLHPARDEIASPLAALALYPRREKVILAHGHTVPAAQPFWPDTNMRHFLVVRPLIPVIEPVQLAQGIHVDFLQVIPVFESELLYKARHGAEALLELWKQRHVRFWDPARNPQST